MYTYWIYVFTVPFFRAWSPEEIRRLSQHDRLAQVYYEAHKSNYGLDDGLLANLLYTGERRRHLFLDAIKFQDSRVKRLLKGPFIKTCNRRLRTSRVQQQKLPSLPGELSWQRLTGQFGLNMATGGRNSQVNQQTGSMVAGTNGLGDSRDSTFASGSQETVVQVEDRGRQKEDPETIEVAEDAAASSQKDQPQD